MYTTNGRGCTSAAAADCACLKVFATKLQMCNERLQFLVRNFLHFDMCLDPSVSIHTKTIELRNGCNAEFSEKSCHGPQIQPVLGAAIIKNYWQNGRRRRVWSFPGREIF